MKYFKFSLFSIELETLDPSPPPRIPELAKAESQPTVKIIKAELAKYSPGFLQKLANWLMTS